MTYYRCLSRTKTSRGTGMESALVYSCEYRASNMWIRANPYITHYFSYGIRTGFFTGKHVGYNEQLRDAKHVKRQLERKLRHSKTKSDYEAYRKQCSIGTKELYTAKTEFYPKKIIDNQGDYKSLFNIANTLLVNQNCATMPSSDDDSVLAEFFSNFFVEKILN